MDETSTGLYNRRPHRATLSKKIEFYRHNIGEHDRYALLHVLEGTFLTTGAVVTQFEEKFAQYMNVSHAIGLTSCTHALELALRGLGVGPGDEVITTALSFVATANAIEHVGAKPVFVDVEHDTGNIDARKITHAITSRTRAIMPVHLYGQMVDMKNILMLAKKHELKVIEDAAHCIEGERDGIRPGQSSDVACFSFYATKNLTSGEGGALVCRNQVLYDWFLRARSHGLSTHAVDRYAKKYQHYDMTFLGYKANMSNIQAALLVNQLDCLEMFWARKAAIAREYTNAFTHCREIRLLEQVPASKHAHHLYTIHVDPKKRDRLLHQLYDAGIGVTVNYTPIHLMTYYAKKYGYTMSDFPNAERIGASTISLPFYPRLTDDEVQYVIDTVMRLVRA